MDVGVDIGVVDEDRDAMRRAAMRTNSRHGDTIDSQDQSHFFPRARSRGRRKEEIKKARDRGKSERGDADARLSLTESGLVGIRSGLVRPGLARSRVGGARARGQEQARDRKGRR